MKWKWKETTYQRYRRENIEMKKIISADAKSFLLGTNDFQKRLQYLIKCMDVYRYQKRLNANR